MSQTLTDWLRHSRLVVVDIQRELGRVRVRSEESGCSDLTCGAQAVVVDETGTSGGLDTLNPGDVVKIATEAGQPDRLV
ncbi:hypothetical protein, partial [Salmonella sp. SAL4446]|uniref:hypothetical protein n=1 Tax=Salmonella sp. SAL4446 TaxID=3159901 RepID=UPI00397B19DC